MLSASQEAELLDLHRRMTVGPLENDDLTAVETAIAKQHLSLQFVKNPSEPWEGRNRTPCRALLIVGAFRTGKTYLTEYAVRRLKAFQIPAGELSPKPVQVTASPHFAIEQLGRDILNRLNLLPARSLGPNRTMERVATRFALKQPTLLCIDEAQRMAKPDRVSAHRLGEEQVKIFGHLRDIMDMVDWPVPVVLTGTTELVTVLERKDMGFFRDRMDIVHLKPMEIGSESDHSTLMSGLVTYCGLAEMKVDLKGTTQFADRLIRAVNHARGLGLEVCREAILIAANEGRKTVTVEDFASYYARKTRCARQANPFLAQDWHRIDPLVLMAAVTGDKPERVWEVRQ